MCSNETNVMQTLKKIPGKALESETIQGSFYVSTVEQPNPGLNIMEIWKTIKEFPDYMINNNGKVLSKSRVINLSNGWNRKHKARILTPWNDKDGYPRVTLSKNKKTINKKISRLVAVTFIPNPKNKPCNNHINGIKTDNRVENLEWVTYSENTLHLYRVLGYKQIGKPVAQYDLNGTLLNTFESATATSKHINGYQGGVSANCRGIKKTYYGYIFKYI